MNDGLRIAERQYGVVTRSQLHAIGLSASQIERRVSARRIELIYPGVYRVVGSVPTSRQRALGACLWLAPEALVSHTTAAALLRLDGVRTTDLHLTVPGDERRGRSRAEVIVHRTTSLPRRDRREVDGIPCTSAARTLVDISAMVDDEALEAAFESARRMGLTTHTPVARISDAAGRRNGRAALARVLDHAAARPLDSRLEVKLSRLLRASSLPSSLPQYQLDRYRLDHAWPEARVGIEADGFQYHGRWLLWKRDRRRIATIESLGWRLVHVTWEDVTRAPAQTLDRLALALGILAA